MVAPFDLRLPEVLFGPGRRREIGPVARRFGRRALLVTGAASLRRAGHFDEIAASLEAAGVSFDALAVEGEPSPDLVDDAAAHGRTSGIDVVVAVGGGAALDAGKAVSAMLPQAGSVLAHLEGLPGARPHDGRKAPFVAVPTTAGTGSEATKNAVLSRPGPGGFKRSLRHDALVPDVAIVDPELSASCPLPFAAAAAMDAFTQCLEGYVSPAASPATDLFAEDGLRSVASALDALARGGTSADDPDAVAAAAWGAFCSGVVLAHAGLGIVHGLAGPIGSRTGAPHGAVCGTLLAAAVEANLRALRSRAPVSPALARYARAGALAAGRRGETAVDEGCALLTAALARWTEALPLPRLGGMGLRAADVAALAARPDMKRNPVALEPGEIAALLERRL